MLQRILRAIRLDPTVFREVADDQNAMKEAAIIVVVVTLLSAIGSAVASGNFVGTLLVNLLAGIVVGWIGWAAITYFVGKTMFKGQTDIPEMMRVLGYASAPKFLGILGIIPCVGWIGVVAGWILSLIAGVFAIREAMELDTTNAVITMVISWVIAFVITMAIGLLFGGGAAALSTITG
jgi:hypothetical protein